MAATAILPGTPEGERIEVAMLTHLRQRVELTLAQVDRAMLSTCGPADIQSGEFVCEARGMRLYMRVPLASDHLFNLETHGTVVVSTPGWQLRGHAQVIDADDAPPDLALGDDNGRRWTALLAITPTRVQIAGDAGCQGDTIDVDE